MKRILLALAVAISAIAGNALTINPQYTKFMNLNYREPCGNFEKHKFQSISGCFDGKNQDTLTLFPLDGEWSCNPMTGDDEFYYNKWIVISKFGTVPSKSYNTWYPELIYEGDLDGNGRDEYGVLLTGYGSAWCRYHINTLYNGKNCEFLEVDYWDDEQRPYTSIAQPGGAKGKVRVYESNMNNAGYDNSPKSKIKTITKFLR